MKYPDFITDNLNVNKAYRLAISTLAANTMLFQDGILEKEKPVFIAGLGYYSPWTRDAAINTWNGGGLVDPNVALNTLKSVLGKNENGYYIEGQYWDKIIWTIGAWWYYLYTGDFDFLKISYEAVVNSLEYLESTEFSEEFNLFRGAACYGDGVSAYPDIYARHGRSGISAFPKENKELCKSVGVGTPMHVLSTNCLYYQAYVLADKMAEKLGKTISFKNKAEILKNAINHIFWDQKKKNYRYIYDEFGGSDAQEGLGICFAILFGIADDKKCEDIFRNTVITDQGLACVYPSFSRYHTEDGMGFGRHSGTIWPHVQGFWADAAAMFHKQEVFDFEFQKQTEHTVEGNQFAEIYHPITGDIYGGLQEDNKKGIREWRSEPVQTWSATAYLRQVYFDILGMKFQEKGIVFDPICTKLINNAELKGLCYRGAVLNIRISGRGEKLEKFILDGKESVPFISAQMEGEHHIEMVLE